MSAATYVVVHRSRRQAAHHACGLHPALLVVRVLLVALDHGEEVILLLHVRVLAAVAAILLGQVHGARVEAHLLVVGDSALDDDQVLHPLLCAVGGLHLGVGDVGWRLLPGAEGALGGHSISLVLLIRRQQEDITLVFIFLNDIRLDSLVNEVRREAALAPVLVDEGTRLGQLQAIARPVVRVVRVVHGALRVQQVVNVWSLPHLVQLTAVDDSLKILLVAVQSQRLRVAVHSAVLVVLLREAVLVVSYRIP